MVLETEYKKKYCSPCAEIELFSIHDVIRTSGSQDDHDEEDDEDPWGTGGSGARAFQTWDGEF